MKSYNIYDLIGWKKFFLNRDQWFANSHQYFFIFHFFHHSLPAIAFHLTFNVLFGVELWFKNNNITFWHEYGHQ